MKNQPHPRMDKQHRLVMEISDQILELIDDADKIPYSDLQGAAEAIAMVALEAGEKLHQEHNHEGS